jgi:hypothetical protein
MTTAASPIPACPERQLLGAAGRKAAATDHAEAIRQDVLLGLQSFDDTFLEALGGDFLTEADERRLRERYLNRPAALRLLLLRNQRSRTAQRALHGLYNKLIAGIAMTPEEQALAEHARDLCQGYAQGEIERRCGAAGL